MAGASPVKSNHTLTPQTNLSVPTTPHTYLFFRSARLHFLQLCHLAPPTVDSSLLPPNLPRTEIPPRDPETSRVKEGAGGGMQGASLS